MNHYHHLKRKGIKPGPKNKVGCSIHMNPLRNMNIWTEFHVVVIFQSGPKMDWRTDAAVNWAMMLRQTDEVLPVVLSCWSSSSSSSHPVCLSVSERQIGHSAALPHIVPDRHAEVQRLAQQHFNTTSDSLYPNSFSSDFTFLHSFQWSKSNLIRILHTTHKYYCSNTSGTQEP